LHAADDRALRAYYARRAAEYERIYARPERQADLARLCAEIPAALEGATLLELACGTGWWTRHGARLAASWLATDVNPETLAIAQHKVMPACVRFAVVDAYTLSGLEGQHFDGAFAGFWWSHVPLARLRSWLTLLHAKLDAGARVVLLDNRFITGSSTPIARRDDDGNSYQQRTLDDGSVHEVLKNFPDRDGALAALGARARDPVWNEHTHYWVLSYTLA